MWVPRAPHLSRVQAVSGRVAHFAGGAAGAGGLRHTGIVIWSMCYFGFVAIAAGLAWTIERRPRRPR